MKRTAWKGIPAVVSILIILVLVALAGGCTDSNATTTTSQTPTKEVATTTPPTTSPKTTATTTPPPTTTTVKTTPPTTKTTATYSVDIAVYPSGAGTVSPSGGVYEEGTELTLSATATEGYVFDHWGGDVEGESSSLQLTVNSSLEVRAIFAQIPPEFIILSHDSYRNASNWLVVSGQVKNEGYFAIERATIQINWCDAQGDTLWYEAVYFYDVQPGQIIDFEFTNEISDEELELLPEDLRQSILQQHQQVVSYEISARIED